MDVAPHVSGLKDRPDPSPDQRRDKGRDGRQPARTDGVTLLRVRGVKPLIKTPRVRDLPVGRRGAAPDREVPNSRAKFMQRGPSLPNPGQRRLVGSFGPKAQPHRLAAAALGYGRVGLSDLQLAAQRRIAPLVNARRLSLVLGGHNAPGTN